jgi:hypothetical protein
VLNNSRVFLVAAALLEGFAMGGASSAQIKSNKLACGIPLPHFDKQTFPELLDYYVFRRAKSGLTLQSDHSYRMTTGVLKTISRKSPKPVVVIVVAGLSCTQLKTNRNLLRNKFGCDDNRCFESAVAVN